MYRLRKNIESHAKRRALILRGCLCSLLSLILVLFFVLPSLRAEDSLTRDSGLSFRAGYHFYPLSREWTGSLENAINNDLYFKSDPSYHSENSAPSYGRKDRSVPFLTVEYQMTLNGARLPFLKNVESVRNLQSLKAGIGLTFYPINGMNETIYQGPIIYHNPNALAPRPNILNYQGEISVRENLFVFFPSFTLYYVHEKSIGSLWGIRLLPYGGLENGLVVINGKRKITMSTDPLYVPASGETYQISASIQESFFNALSYRGGLHLGGLIPVDGRNHIDIRLSFIYQNTPLTMTRSGAWSETINGSSYSRRVYSEKSKTSYSQTGYQFTIGYTVGLP